MFTLHHGFWLYFFTRHHSKTGQFVLGSMLPDYIYGILVGVMLFQGKIDWRGIFHMDPVMLMSFVPVYPWAMKTDLTGHSLVVWGCALPLFFIALKKYIPFYIGWGTHIFIDELTHSAYANYLFYPLSLKGVHSPVSYWEPQYFSQEFKIVNGTLMAAAAFYLIGCWWMKKHKSEE
jgi:hypothetical protein